MSHLDFDIVSTVTCAPGRCPAEDFDIRISSLCYINSTNSYVRIYKQIIQNKPNLRKSQMYVKPYNTTDYEIFLPLAGQKNKPNTNPNKPNLKRAKMNVTLLATKDYRKKDDFEVRINKPNSNPIAERVKIDAKCVFTKDYEE